MVKQLKAIPEGRSGCLRSGNVDAIGTYQDAGIHLDFELGKIGPFRFIVNAWAKVFHAAGVVNASSVATTIAASATANLKLATTIEVAANTNIAAGQWLLVGTIETGNTFDPQNEYVGVGSVSGTSSTNQGQGPNGGLGFTHRGGGAGAE